MKLNLFSGPSKFFTIIAASICLGGCSSDSEDMKSFRERVEKEDELTSKMMQDNLDDELNPVERQAVDPIFEKNTKEKERTDQEIFKDTPKE